jgi:hypothetical protein
VLLNFFGYQVLPDDVTNTITVVIVFAALYYAFKIVRLSNQFEYVALRGGKAPYFIIAGLIFLEIDRIFDLFTVYLSRFFGFQFAVTFNDPPAALAAFFITLGLREMYVVYIKNSKAKRRLPAHQEIWPIETESGTPKTQSYSKKLTLHVPYNLCARTRAGFFGGCFLSPDALKVAQNAYLLSVTFKEVK